MNQVSTAVQKVRSNIDWKLVTSQLVAVGLLGLGLYALEKSGVKPLRTAAGVVKKGV